jgi:iron-sulfur cluster assembly protein
MRLASWCELGAAVPSTDIATTAFDIGDPDVDMIDRIAGPAGSRAFASVTSAPDPTRKEVRAMLALTDRAVEAVRDIVSSSGEAAETGGLRMTADRDGATASFKLRVVSLPAEDDAVIEEHGARVFIEPEAATLLDDKVLDATVDRDQVAFTVVERNITR